MENKSWKTIALKSVFGGAGFTLTILLIIGGVIWYQSIPKPPKAWDNNAIIASYDHVDTTGENNIVVFYYILENKTDFDYPIEDKNNFFIYANLERPTSLSGGKSGGKPDELLSFNYPVNIPSKHRLFFKITLNYPTEIKSPPFGASKENKEKHRKELEDYVTKEFNNLNGFTLFDYNKRYKIEFKPGWKVKRDLSHP